MSKRKWVNIKVLGPEINAMRECSGKLKLDTEGVEIGHGKM